MNHEKSPNLFDLLKFFFLSKTLLTAYRGDGMLAAASFRSQEWGSSVAPLAVGAAKAYVVWLTA